MASLEVPKIPLKDLEESEEEMEVIKSEIDQEENAFSYDGYERLHDEAMDKISVNILYSENEGDENYFSELSTNSTMKGFLKKQENNEKKKIKISLSQEQIKPTNSKHLKLLSVPVNVKKNRSGSFAVGDRQSAGLFSSSAIQSDKLVSGSNPKSFSEISEMDVMNDKILVSNDNKLSSKQMITLTPAVDEIVYDVPRTNSSNLPTQLSMKVGNNMKNNSFASNSPRLSMETVSSYNINLKFPNTFYCKMCSNILNDPRVLNCLHSFCFKCLTHFDASLSFQSNPYWTKAGVTTDADWNVSRPSRDFSIMSRSSIESDTTQKMIDKRSSLTGSFKGRKLLKSPFKDKFQSPTMSARGRQSSIISYSEKPIYIICPTCGITTEMSIHDIYRLPQNHILSRKIAIKNCNEISKTFCQLCSFDVLATATCITCGFNLCNNCKEVHKRHTSQHELKIIDKKLKKASEKAAMKPDKNIKCLMHSNYDLKLFCTTCCQTICAECTVLLHRGHKTTSISKASKVYMQLVKDSMEKTKPMSTYAIHSISKLNDLSKKINNKCDYVENEVEIFLAEYFEALEVHKKTLMNQIARAREAKMDSIRCQQLDLERRSNEAKTAIAFTETLLKDGNEVENLLFVNILLKKFEQCRSSDISMDIKITDSLQFLSVVKAPSNKAQNNIQLYGIITTQTAAAKYCSLETSISLMNLRVLKKAEMVLQTRDIEGREMCHGSAQVDVECRYKEVSFKIISTQVSDKRDGTYIINFVPEIAGEIQISIHVNGRPIKNSPFIVRARNLRPHSGIYHCCSFCSSNGSKNCACDGLMDTDGYRGCGHGHNGWPGRRHWSCCASVLENSECTIANALPSHDIV